MAFDRFSQRDFEDFLGVQPDGKPVEKGGFYRIPVPGVNEVVYAKKVAPDLSLRVFSTLEGGVARTKDSDAIRVTIVWKPSDEEVALMLKDGVITDPKKQIPMLVGGEASVYRVPTWRDNLGARLASYEDILPSRCRCGCPNVLVKPNKRNGDKWEPFWGCVLYKRCPLKTGVKQSKPEAPAKPAPRVPVVQPKLDHVPPPRPYRVPQSAPAPVVVKPRPTPVATGPGRWDTLPAWQTIPTERRRAGSKIPYNDPPY